MVQYEAIVKINYRIRLKTVKILPLVYKKLPFILKVG